MRLSLLLSLFIFTLISCTEVDNDSYIVNDPFITFKFINGDSLSVITGNLEEFQNLDTSLNEALDLLDSSLSALGDSIEIIQAGIDTGNFEFLNLQETLMSLFSLDSLEQLEIKSNIDENDSSINANQVIISSLKEGLSRLDFIEAIHSGYLDQSFKDSLDDYNIPLNVSDTLSEYEIGINGVTYSITLSHVNTESISPRQAFFISITDIKLISHDFLEVTNDCGNQPCKSNAAVFTCYY